MPRQHFLRQHLKGVHCCSGDIDRRSLLPGQNWQAINIARVTWTGDQCCPGAIMIASVGEWISTGGHYCLYRQHWRAIIDRWSLLPRVITQSYIRVQLIIFCYAASAANKDYYKTVIIYFLLRLLLPVKTASLARALSAGYQSTLYMLCTNIMCTYDTINWLAYWDRL